MDVSERYGYICSCRTQNRIIFRAVGRRHALLCRWGFAGARVVPTWAIATCRLMVRRLSELWCVGVPNAFHGGMAH